MAVREMESCPFHLGDRVDVTNPEYSADWREGAVIVGLEWPYRHGAARVNITIATEAEIRNGDGATDGWLPEDLRLVSRLSANL